MSGGFVRRLLLATALALGWGGAPVPAGAQAPVYTVWIGGLPLSCNDYFGNPVRIMSDPSLPNVGIATQGWYGEPLIVLNPDVLARFSPTVQVWWFAHECAHKALGPANNETNADCFGIRRMRQYGMITSYHQLAAFSEELRDLAGSPMGHLPGPIRAANIINCALY